MKKIIAVLIKAMVTSIPFNSISSGSEIRENRKMEPGVVFKAPEATDSFNHAILENRNHIKGAEIYLNWSDIEKTEGIYDWSVIDQRAEQYDLLGKKISVSISTASFAANDSPEWLFNDYNVRRIAKGYWLNFEKTETDYQILDEVVEYSNRGYGNYAVLSGSSESVMTDFFRQPLYSQHGYSIQFDFDTSQKTTLLVRVVSESAPEHNKTFKWEVNAGEKGSGTAEFHPEVGIGDYQVIFGTESGSAILDNINIVELKPGFFVGNLTFPNYFDPVFIEKYRNFVEAFAAKYKDDPRVDLIYVGGFGRWEELTLCNDAPGQLFSLEDQWLSYGYSDAAYIDHVKACADMYKESFGNKNLMMTVAGFKGADSFKNQALLDWKISQYVAKMGIVIKYNGWQERSTEWNNESNCVFNTIYRHKYDPGSMMILEQGAQVNNVTSEIIGHPISLMNKAIAYGADYFWIYNNDLLDPYFSRYLQYLNESAGGVLNTRIYVKFFKSDYYSQHARKAFQHYNLTWQIYQNRDKSGTKSNYVNIDGEHAAATAPGNSCIVLSVDDRIKIAGTYSASMDLEYLDNGTDSVSIYIQTDKGIEELATWNKTGTGKWITKTFPATAFMNTYKGGNSDSFGELTIEDNNDGIEVIKGIEIDYVPAEAFVQKVVSSLEPGETEKSEKTEKTDTTQGVSFELDIPDDQKIQTLAIPLMCSDISEISSAIITVESSDDSGNTLIERKECYMPEDFQWVEIPLGSHVLPSKVKVSVKSTRGTVYIASKNNAPSYRLMSYVNGEAEELKAEENGVLRLGRPFDTISVRSKKIAEDFKFYRIHPDGSKTQINYVLSYPSDNGDTLFVFEPKTAGAYSIEGLKDDRIKYYPLVSKQVYSKPKRELIGNAISVFKTTEWSFFGGFKDLTNTKLGASASVIAPNAYIESTTPLNIEPDDSHHFRIVIRNNTASSLAKISWKTAGQDYCEENSAFIPIISNDSDYREYSYNIGYEKSYRESDNITGFRLTPVYGNIQAGDVDVSVLELREGFEVRSGYNEPLDVTNLEGYLLLSGSNTRSNFPMLILSGIAAFILATAAGWFFSKRKMKAKEN